MKRSPNNRKIWNNINRFQRRKISPKELQEELEQLEDSEF